jgi:small subunit ribosomal protein S6
VRMDEEQKRIYKIKAIRATRKKLSAQPAAVPVAAPVEAAAVEAPAEIAESVETAPANA